MNKDLDERLVPNGEYRDAMNIQISSSEDNDVGAVQNIRGTKEIFPTTQVAALNAMGSPKCIGAIANGESNKIYWFIAGTSKDGIAEYDTATGAVTPILISDTALNFTSDYKITGINVITGDKKAGYSENDVLLFWTDNQSEPKQINITKYKEDYTTSAFNVNTQINSVNVKESDITVIKKSPLNAPTLTMSATKKEGNLVGTGNNPAFCSFNFSEQIDGTTTYELMQPGQTELRNGSLLEFDFTPLPNFEEGDELIFSGSQEVDNVLQVFQVRIKVTELLNEAQKINGEILSIDSNVPAQSTNITYEVLVDEGDPLFELKIPRFAYRWKYKGGQYSCFSPFSEPAFLPAKFDYATTDGHNKSMVNSLRALTISGFDTKPYEVEEVDILYKESDNNLVYVAKTLKNSETSFKVEREIFSSVVEENQLLRHFDNVPKKALAQEVVANRVVYGNYTQNYTINKETEPDLELLFSKQTFSPSQSFKANGSNKVFTLTSAFFKEFPSNEVDIAVFIDNVLSSEIFSYNPDNKQVTFENAPANNSIVKILFDNIGKPKKSIKTLRNYQAGISFVDKYGRISPVFTNAKASKYVDMKHSEGIVKLHAKPKNLPPNWATHYKIYIKEGSSEYYNLLLDNYYAAEDGNVWLSFPSSERNKIEKGDFIVLKKQHDTSDNVTSDNKFKILDIQNNAPEFIKTSKRSVASSEVKIKGASASSSGSDFDTPPHPGSIVFKFLGPNDNEHSSFARSFFGSSFVRFKKTGNVSRFYEIESGGPTGVKLGNGDAETIYEVTLKESISDVDSFLNNLDTVDETFTLEVFDEVVENTQEFEGRFFIKIKRNDIVDTHIIGPSTESLYDTIYEQRISRNLAIRERGGGASEIAWQDVHDDQGTGLTDQAGAALNWPWIKLQHSHPEINKKDVLIVSHDPGYGQQKKDAIGFQESEFEKNLKGDGETLIQFVDANDVESRVYRIHNLKISANKRGAPCTSINGIRPAGGDTNIYENSIRHEIRFEIEDDENKSPGFSEDNFSFDSNIITHVRFKRRDLNREYVLSSKNPAVFETEPKEVADLDFYHEVSNTLGIIKVGMTVSGTGISGTPTVTNVTPSIINFSTNQTLALNTVLTFTDSTNNITATATVAGATSNVASVKIKNGGYFGQLELDWFNCYTYGNGVESNRIRDDFNAPFIDKGPKVSTVLDTPYIEEHRKNGLIYSGIYNSTSGINKLNQFIAGEKITKDLNPEYGSIQKLHTRDTDLTVLCEDKVLKVLANKDALFNADGNINLTSTNNVLGQAVPYAGNYGISKNPESFASYGYRAYFADKSRGSVLRLSRDGITPISSNGMKSWFKTNLKNATTILGYYNDKQDEYDISLQGTTDYTLSFDEKTTGWVSFKSYVPEAGLCLNNVHYTFKNARIWSHDNKDENNEFYGVSGSSATDPHITLIFNEAPNVVKSFRTINYEGSRAYQVEIHVPGIGYTTFDKLRDTSSSTYSLTNVDDFEARSIAGWKVTSAITDINSGDGFNFIRKENKWFSNLNKDVFAYENDQFVRNSSVESQNSYGGNLDPAELTFQGIGRIKSNGLTGATTQGKYKVRIQTSGVGAKNMTLTSVSGPGTWILDKVNLADGIVQNNNVSTLDSIEPVVLTFTCNDGFENPGSQALATQSPSGTFNSVAYAQPTTTTNTVSLSFASATLSADKHITITLNNAATAITTEKSIAGTYNYNVRNTSTPNSDLAVPVNTAYNNTGTKGLTEVLITRTITAKAGHGFGRLVDGVFEEDTPTAIIEQQGDETGVYSISTANRVLQDGKLTSIDIVVSYTYGDKSTVTGDKIIFFARAKALHSAPADKVKGYFWTRINNKNVHVPDASDIDIDGETRYLNVWGEAGATFGVTCSTATVFMDGSLNNITSKTLNAKTDLNRIRVDFPATVSSVTHTFTLTGSDLDSSIAGGNPFTLTQVANVTITFEPHSLRYNNASEVTVFEDSNLDGTFNTAANTADSITRTFRAYSLPQLNTKFSEIPFKYVFNDGAAANVTRTITADDFSNTISTANGGTVMRVENLTQTVATNNLTITGKYIIERYGNTSFTTLCAQGNIEGSGSGTGSIIYLSIANGSNVSNATLTSGNQLIVGHTDYQSGDVISGTATITINCPGYLAGDVTLSYDNLDGITNNNSATNPTFSGTGTSSTSATFNWSFTLSENVDSGDTFGFRVNASLDTP